MIRVVVTRTTALLLLICKAKATAIVPLINPEYQIMYKLLLSKSNTLPCKKYNTTDETTTAANLLIAITISKYKVKPKFQSLHLKVVRFMPKYVKVKASAPWDITIKISPVAC